VIHGAVERVLNYVLYGLWYLPLEFLLRRCSVAVDNLSY
jgi:hypothetical protein